MGLFDSLIRTMRGEPAPNVYEGVQVPPRGSVGELRVFGTVYHQKFLLTLEGAAVPLRIRPTNKSDRFRRYEYQVYTGSVLVGGLNQYAVDNGLITNMQTYAYVDREIAMQAARGVDVSSYPDYVRLFIPRRS